MKRKMKYVYLCIPKYSNSKGYADVRVSEILKKPQGFKYSETFLSKWYSDIEKYDLCIKIVKSKKKEKTIIK